MKTFGQGIHPRFSSLNNMATGARQDRVTTRHSLIVLVLHIVRQLTAAASFATTSLCNHIFIVAESLISPLYFNSVANSLRADMLESISSVFIRSYRRAPFQLLALRFNSVEDRSDFNRLALRRGGFPSAFARASPDMTRSRIISCSNSASTPII